MLETANVAPPSVVVWSYPGRTQVEAGQLYAKHATALDGDGYVPIAQSWGEGRPRARDAYL